MTPTSKPQTIRNRAGFTLVELLVVISIILIASSILFTAGSGEKGVSLSSSQRIVSGIVKGARAQAVLKGAETRIIIYNNLAGDPDKYRRYFGIVYLPTPERPSRATCWPRPIDQSMVANGGYPG